MKLIRDEFNLLPVLWKLEYFSEYLKDVEELVDSKAKELENRAKVMTQELERDEDFPNTHDAYFFLEEDYEKIENRMCSRTFLGARFLCMFILSWKMLLLIAANY